jgi:dUTPase
LNQPFFRLMSGRIERATKDSAAFDLFSAEPEPICVGDVPILIKTGVRSEFSPGYVAIMKERSGLGLKGLELKAGVIDADYRGEWGVVCRFPLRFHHLIDPSTNEFKVFPDPNWRPFVVEPGAKLAQFLLVETAKLEMVNGGGTFNFFEDVRGERGFGSSG